MRSKRSEPSTYCTSAVRTNPSSCGFTPAETGNPKSFGPSNGGQLRTFEEAAFIQNPTIILTFHSSLIWTQRLLDDFHRIWLSELQVRLTRLSKLGKQIVVVDSGRDIPSESPESVVSAVRNVSDLCSNDSSAR